MRFPSSVQRNCSVVMALAAGLMIAQEPAQQGPGAAPGGGGTTGGGTQGGGFPSTGGGGRGNPGTQSPFPNDRQQQQQRFPDQQQMQRPIFLSGKVVLDDGTAPPEPVVIERVCNGQPRPEGYTDSKGRFSFQLGQNQGMMQDASVSSADPLGGGFDNSGGFGQQRGGAGGFGGGPMGRGISERDLMGCEIRAVLPGYRSEAVSLAGRRMMDNPDIGTIIMKRLGNVEGLTLSATSGAAPKDAKKAYEKARDLMRKKKVAEAQKEYEKAVGIYPKYANAWAELGAVQEQLNDVEGARKSYEAALAADSKLVTPYVQLAFLWARDNKWQETADASERALKLNPFDYPRAYFINSVANLNLQKLEAAEKSAREGMKLDANNRIPKFKHVLGIVLAQKQDFAGASENMKSYLAAVPPDSQEAAMVKKQLAEVEKFAANQANKGAAAAQQ